MLFDESFKQLGKQFSFHLRSFFYFDDFFSITVRVKRYYTSYFHLRFFVWESLISFHFLILFSLVTLSGTNVKGMFCFQKVSCSFSLISSFLLLPRFHHEWNWLHYFTKQKIWRNRYMTYWSNACVVEWNRKISLRLRNKTLCKRLKSLVEFFSN